MSTTQSRRAPSVPIRYALPGVLALLIVVAVSLTAWVSYRSGQLAASEVASRLSGEVAERVQERVATFMEVPHQFHAIHTAAVSAGQLELGDLRKLARYFWNEAYISRSAPYLYYGTKDGYFVGVDTNFGEQGAVFKIVDQDSIPDRLTYKLDENGNPTGDPSASKYDPRERPWYQAAVKAGVPTWSPIYSFSARRELGISPVAPVYDAEGKLLGVLGIDLTLADLTDFLRDNQPSPNGRAYIVENDGSLVATSALEEPFSVITTTNSTGEPQASQVRLNAKDSADPLVAATTQYLAVRFGGFDRIPFAHDPDGNVLPQSFVFERNGEQQLGEVLQVSDARGLNWLIVVVIPAGDFMAQVYENLRQSLLLGTAVLVGATIAGFLFASWIIAPVTTVIRVAAGIEKANYDLEHLTPVAARTDELGQLARVFKRMAGEVYAREQQLKQRVAQLQIEIDEAKRQKQVEEIVETDFFRDLQAKAQRLRSGRTRTRPEPAATQEG